MSKHIKFTKQHVWISKEALPKLWAVSIILTLYVGYLIGSLHD